MHIRMCWETRSRLERAILPPRVPPAAKDPLAAVLRHLQECRAAGPRSAREMAVSLRLPAREVVAILRQLEADGVVRHVRDGWELY